MATDVDQKVNSILENIKKSSNNNDEKSSQVEENKVKKPVNKTKKANENEIRGVPKSGRFWKSKKEKFSKIIKTKGIRPDYQKKEALRIELKRTKDISHQILDQIKEKEEARKQRRRENIKRAEENKRKSEIVQVITNTKKLKRMKKKQLRFIEKRDINVNKENKQQSSAESTVDK
ncbi:coiled-coil domain-containing protein 86 [Danaus plexippus]|uniref:coiled-coil domain-containing protein 86 n=1 Tax=Danaus plexippus TaxID=13037 RepID=UPI002AAFB9B0|nr:coiled-coil domain-containing protein 86 [Danaus plexippus]